MKFIYAALIMCCYIWNKSTSNPKLIIYKNKAKSVVFQILDLILHPKRVVWQTRQTYVECRS